MIELLVIIAIATIGVVYTSSTGEAESSAMAEKTAKDALNEAEGQSGIGILGIDVVARKMRRMVGLQEGAVGADTLAEYRGSDEEEDQVGEPMALAGEVQPETFEAVRDDLVHVHANEPGFDILGTSGKVDHAKIGTCLKDIGYDGYVSIEQRMVNGSDPLADIAKSVQHLKECYS